MFRLLLCLFLLCQWCRCFMVIVFGVFRCLFWQWRCLCRIIVETGLTYHLVYVACSVRLVCSATALEFLLLWFLVGVEFCHILNCF